MSGEGEVTGVGQTNYGAFDVDDRPPESIDLMPEPSSFAMDPLAELEMLLVAMHLEDRSNAREQSRAEEEMIEREGANLVAAMHDRADEIRTEGWWSGLGQIGGGLLTAAGGVVGLSVDEKATTGKFWSDLLGGLGSVSEGVGALGASASRADQTEIQASETQFQTTMASAERRAEQANADMANARQALRDLLTQVQRIHEEEAAARQAAIYLT